MKTLTTALFFCFYSGVLMAQNDTVKCSGSALIYSALDNSLLWYPAKALPIILADDIIFSGSYTYDWNQNDSTLVIFGYDIGVGVGNFMPVSAKFIKYKIENNSIEEIARFDHTYSQYGLSPFAINVSQSGNLQVLNENGIVLEKDMATLTYPDFISVLDYMRK